MSESVDLSNARVIAFEWVQPNKIRPRVGTRESRENNFICFNPGETGVSGFYRENSDSNVYAEVLNLRVLEEFPPLTLKEQVGDAVAFTFIRNDNSMAAGSRVTCVNLGAGLWAVPITGDYGALEDIEDDFKPTNIVTLYPRN